MQRNLIVSKRRGELCGLRWRDVDVVESRISVRQTLEITRKPHRGRCQKLRRSAVQGTQNCGVSAFFQGRKKVIQALQKQRAAENRKRLAFGGVYQDNDLVFCQPDRSPINSDKFSLMTPRNSSKSRALFLDFDSTICGISFASQMLRECVHFEVASEMLGHASVAITLDRYSHVLEGMDVDAAEALDNLYRRAQGA